MSGSLWFGSRFSNLPIEFKDKLERNRTWRSKRVQGMIRDLNVQVSFEPRGDRFDIITRGHRFAMWGVDGMLMMLLRQILPAGHPLNYRASKISAPGYGRRQKETIA